MSDSNEVFYIKDTNGNQSDPYPSFAEAVFDCDEGYTVYDNDGVAIYPQSNKEILCELRKGDKGDKVKAVQLLLIGYGYELLPFGADGNFSSLMEEKVNEYKKSFDLVPDGVVDISTWKLLLGGD